MSNPTFSIKGVNAINEYTPSMNLERNITMYFDYSTVKISGFGNITYNASGSYGGNLSKLNSVNSYQYGTGRVWEGYRNNWVWENIESGFATNAVNISGIYTNGTYQTSGYVIDYKYGQVIFNSGIPTGTDIRCSYSSKSIWWDTADSKWFRELITETARKDVFDANGIGSGIRNVITNHRIQLPAVIVEVTSKTDFSKPGYQLGGGQWFRPTVLFHIFAENADQKKYLTDLITNQNEGSFLGVDFNKVRASGDQPFDGFNILKNTAKTMPQLYNLYPWQVKPITFKNMTGIDVPYVPDIYRALVRCDMELVLLCI